MTVEVIAQFALQYGVIPILFIWLLYDTRKESRELLIKSQEREAELQAKSQERETKLMEHIAKSDKALEDFADSLARISGTLDGMDKNMGYLQKDVEELKAK